MPAATGLYNSDLSLIKLSIIVPCFNEADGLNAFFTRLELTLDNLQGYRYEIICIDDGSRDNTLEILCLHAARNHHIEILELSRNFGKEAALTAGIDAARGEAIIPLDADLQHPPELIHDMIKEWENGSDVVLARRRSRKTDRLTKRLITQFFYQLHNQISECEIPENVGDFRLMDRRVVDAVKCLPERKRFMKGLFAWVGFRQSIVEFDIEPRKSGKSSFSTRRLWALGLDGIASFSTVPLTVSTYAGLIVALLSLVYGSWIIIKTLAFGADVPGYASLLTAVLFLGGIQILGIGILGGYIGRIYNESKQRPVYIIRQRYSRGVENS